VSIRLTLAAYRAEIAACKTLLTKLAGHPFSASELEFLRNAVFFRTFIAWEMLLESMMVKYLLNREGINGNRAKKYSRPKDTAHANRMLIGTQKYVDWANQEIVLRLAKIYFVNGDPFNTALSGIHTDLTDLKTIRNSIAHISTTTSQALDALASRLLGHVMVGAKPQQILLATAPAPPGAIPISFFDYYLQTLDAAANVLASP
jgi:hypothetical protein